MVRRIVALLLIGAWLLQGAVPPHWHAGMSGLDMLAHGQRRHFHWSHESHAQCTRHDGRPFCPAPSPGERSSGALASARCDHDHDAVYVDVASAGNVTADSPNPSLDWAGMLEDFSGPGTPLLEQHFSAPPRYGGQVPAFLATTRLLL